jgi:hypothetical protein
MLRDDYPAKSSVTFLVAGLFFVRQLGCGVVSHPRMYLMDFHTYMYIIIAIAYLVMAFMK